jgi:hypothetical protein
VTSLPSRVAYWAVPQILLLILYWPGFTSWFQKDDFVMLGLRNLVTDGRSLLWTLFMPISQGTIRTLSERVYFIGLSSLFGLEPLPFRIVAFATQSASLALLASLTWKLTGSRAAGFCATVLWVTNSALGIPLSWTAVYYEILCGFFLLLSLWLLVRHHETGNRKYFVLQWITFLLGFLALELNVVYPALAAAYALCCARNLLSKTIPMFIVSALYMLVHTLAAPLPRSGPYALHWDIRIVSTLLTYVNWALGTGWMFVVRPEYTRFRWILAAVLIAGLGGFLVARVRRGEWVAALFPAWFVMVIAPLLPLRDHMMHEYLTVPFAGLAMLGGWALASSWRAGVTAKIVAALCVAIYVGTSIPMGQIETRSYHDRSFRYRDTLLQAGELHHADPKKIVLLSGVSGEQYWDVIQHGAFQLVGIEQTYIVPEAAVPNDPSLGAPNRLFFIDAPGSILAKDLAVVYDISGPTVRDITAEYRARHPADELSAHLDFGLGEPTSQIGPEWYPHETGFSWMPRRATAVLRGNSQAGVKLHLRGACPQAILAAGPLGVHVSVDSVALPVSWLRSEGDFELEWDLPQELARQPKLALAIELDRTFKAAGDTRELGLPVSWIEIR